MSKQITLHVQLDCLFFDVGHDLGDLKSFALVIAGVVVSCVADEEAISKAFVFPGLV
jgi:hypothetical protein